MNSLRTRLVFGFAVVALFPVAVLVGLMAGRIERTVAAQADARLADALDALRAQLQGERTRLATRLALLAGDAELKRLLLVDRAAGPALREHLARQQVLLGLDYLGVLEPSGTLVADAAGAGLMRAPLEREPLGVETLPRADVGATSLIGIASGRALALDASASILYRDEPVAIVRGGILLDSLRLAELRRTSGVELVLWDATGRAVAGTIAAPTTASPRPGTARTRLGARSWFTRSTDVTAGAGPPARIAGFVPTAAADGTLRALRAAALLLGAVATALAVTLGMLWSLQVSRPIERLAEFSQRISRGEWNEPLTLRSVREVQTLVDALERMRGELSAYRERLVASERQAAYGEMARKVAHEIKNPLTPIAVSVADLRRSYAQQRPDFGDILEQATRTVDEEVRTLQRMLQEFSEFGRFPPPRFAPCDVAGLLAELATLHGAAVRDGRLTFTPPGAPLVLRADHAQLRQALHNLVLNALDATPAGGRVRVEVGADAGTARLVVANDGPGLTPEQLAKLFVPGFTTKSHGSGLGLTIVERIVTEHGGRVAVDTGPGRGVTFTLHLPRDPGA